MKNETHNNFILASIKASCDDVRITDDGFTFKVNNTKMKVINEPILCKLIIGSAVIDFDYASYDIKSDSLIFKKYGVEVCQLKLGRY